MKGQHVRWLRDGKKSFVPIEELIANEQLYENAEGETFYFNPVRKTYTQVDIVDNPDMRLKTAASASKK